MANSCRKGSPQGESPTGIAGAVPARRKRAFYIGGEIFARRSFGANHPLSYTRQGAVSELCAALGWLSPERCRTAPQASLQTLKRIHDPSYIGALKAASEGVRVNAQTRAKYKIGTMENPVFSGLFERAASTVGGAILAAQLALEGNIVFHPAGGTHHGKPDRASGFCYFNDPAFAILTLLDAGLKRVLYVDIDAHHGDGVFDLFAGENRVACASIHEAGRWPHTGSLDEQDTRRLNIPVPAQTNDAEYCAALERLVWPFVDRFDPQAVVITCGADALHGDPLSKMELSNHTLWNAVLALGERVDRAIVLGGGGYNPWTTVRCWAGLWGLLAGFELPDKLPQQAVDLLAGFDSDLVEEEDIEPHWLERIEDPVQPGCIRDDFEVLLRQVAQRQGL